MVKLAVGLSVCRRQRRRSSRQTSLKPLKCIDLRQSEDGLPWRLAALEIPLRGDPDSGAAQPRGLRDVQGDFLPDYPESCGATANPCE